MKAPAAFGPGVFVADTSAWVRSRRPALADRWDAALAGGQIAGCPIVVIGLLYASRDRRGFSELEAALGQLREAPVTRTVTNAAVEAMRRLAETGRHRVPPSDLLVAAAAQDAGFGVLHYDRHYDLLAEVLRFESVWVAPPGSLDCPTDPVPMD